MKVKEVLQLLHFSTRWQLIGARTGKKLASDKSTEKTVNRYLECESTEKPIFISYIVRKSPFYSGYDCAEPVISIWVNGE